MAALFNCRFAASLFSDIFLTMTQKELIDEFKAAKWKTSDDMLAFVSKAEGVSSKDIAAMLDIIVETRAKDKPEHGLRVRAFSKLAAGIVDKGLFEPYLHALKSDDRHLRTVLVNLFPNANNPPLLPKLCELLKSSDVNLRRVTNQILQQTADGNAVKILGEMFVEKNFPGRNEAIDIASRSLSYYTNEFFKVVLSSGTAAEKKRALRYLANPDFIKKHRKSIASTVLPALSDSDESVLLEAIELFSRVCSEEDYFDNVGPFLYHSNINFEKAAVFGLRYFSSQRSGAALERKLHIGPNEIRMAVLDTIENIGTPVIQKPLVRALQSRYEVVQAEAFNVLNRLTASGKIEISSAVLWLLTSNDPGVRSRSVSIAASVSGNRSNLWGDILDRLRNENYWVRQQLLAPLSEFAGTELTPLLLKYLSSPDDVMCHFALDLLTKLDGPEALEALIALAKQGGEWWVREKAVNVIANIKDVRTIPFLLDLAEGDPDIRVAVVDAVLSIGADEPRVLSFLKDENPDVRFETLKLVDKLGKPEQAPIVLPMVQDPDTRVRRLAAAILDRWKVDYSSRLSEEKKSAPLLDRLLSFISQAGADDLILLSDNPPYMKKHGVTSPISTKVLSPERLRAMLHTVLTPGQIEDLSSLSDVDFSYEVRNEGLRFRANIFASHAGISGVFRIIRGNVRKLKDLGLPEVVSTFGDYKNGLVLVGGPTGSGKSTTLASIIANIVENSRRHVISIEDPIEVVHKSSVGIINQREVGVHTPTFSDALRMTLREDPDVILVGEMRDLATIQFAVTAAETGHLVFGTVHTVSADSSIDRLINAYPPDLQEQVRSMLANSLKAVLCQYLIRHKAKPEMVLATEIMINSEAIANLIRKGKTFQIPSVIATSRDLKMQSMDTSLMSLFKEGEISAEEAYLKARNKTDFEEIYGIGKNTSPAAGLSAPPGNPGER